MSSPKSRAEAPVHDITFDAINELLSRYPRKKTLLKEYLREYKLLDLDEMSEEIALEMLEIMDSHTYIMALRAKDKYQNEQEHKQFKDNFEKYLDLHSHKYIIVDYVANCWLLAKYITLNVYTKNEMNAFQPVETHEDRPYFIMVMVKIADEFKANDMIGRFVSRSCKIVRIYETAEIHSKMESIR